MRILQVLIGTLFALSLAAGCGYMIYYLTMIPYLPPWLHLLLMVLCGISIIIILYIWISSVIVAFSKREE